MLESHAYDSVKVCTSLDPCKGQAGLLTDATAGAATLPSCSLHVDVMAFPVCVPTALSYLITLIDLYDAAYNPTVSNIHHTDT